MFINQSESIIQQPRGITDVNKWDLKVLPRMFMFLINDYKGTRIKKINNHVHG